MSDNGPKAPNPVTAANVHMMAASKPAALTTAPALVVSTAEATVGNLLDVMSRFAAEAQRRMAEKTLSMKDMKTVNETSRAAVALAVEQREQAKQNSLALNSDEDIVRLLIDAVTSLGPRGVNILELALSRLKQTEKPHEPTKS